MIEADRNSTFYAGIGSRKTPVQSHGTNQKGVRYMRWLTRGLVRAHGPFSWLTPHPLRVFSPNIATIAIGATMVVADGIKMLVGKEKPEEYLGRRLAYLAMRPVTGRARSGIYKSLMMAQVKSQRTLLDPIIQEIERDRDGRIVRRMRIMFHDANRAGQLTKEIDNMYCSFIFAF